MNKPIKIEFAPGCFDNFEGSQEELDELVAEIQKMVDTGEIFEKSKPVDIDELMDEDPEFVEALMRQISDITDLESEPKSQRKLQ